MDSPTILIVDDTPANIDFVRVILTSEGFHTLEAEDGASALALSRERKPDLILLDVLMPVETGFETCTRLKSDPATADIPVIFLSALEDVKSKVSGLKLGAVDFVSKPVYGEELLARVRVHLRIRETSRLLIAKQQARLEQLRAAQQAILVHPQDCPGAAFGVLYEPLEEAGGDFYDVLPVDSQSYGYFVADISGHGLSAAFLTSAIKALLRQYSGPLFSPEDTLRGVDAVMRQMLGEAQYLTACYARLNRGSRLSVVSAGHPPLILVRAGGKVEIAEMDSEPLGVFGSAVLQRRDFRVLPGDRFYLYSDGLIESVPGGGRRAGLEALVDACVYHRAEPVVEAPMRIADALRPDGAKVEDDLVLLAVEVRA